MEQIEGQFVFSRPKLLSTGPHSQVVRFNCKPSRSRKGIGAPASCVLKFYTPANRVRYENELAAFQILLLSSLDLVFPKPVAYAEWSTIKYGKTIGRNVPSITKPGDESIFVLMIDYIENSTPLSSSNVSHEVAKAAIVSLHKLHAIRILHGDISSSNSLLLDEHEPCTVMWVDFSSASINASDKTLALEMKRAINYFGAMDGIRKDDLFQTAALFTSAEPAISDTQDLKPLPQLDESLRFCDWTLMATGTHARIYRTKHVGLEDSPFFCVKMFRRGWMTPFNLESTAYEHFQAANIEQYIPLVYGFDYRTLATWGLPSDPNDDQVYYAIVMEWIEKAETLSVENITLEIACMLLTGLAKIHKAGILHWDAYKRNMLVVRDAERGIWTDFSCSLIGEDVYHEQEMKSVQAMILELLLESGRRRGAREITSAFASYIPLPRRVLGFLFAFSLALEGLAYIFVSINKLHTSHNLTPIWSHSPIKYGALDLFAAALIVMISSAIHLHTPIFNMALVVKFLYLFFNTSTSMIFLTAQGITGALRAWVFVRTIAALLLLANDIGELVGPTQQPLEQLPGWDAGEDLNSDAPSSLRNSSVASHRA